MNDLRAVIHNRFKLNGLGLSSDASKFLQSAFSRLHDRTKLERAVDKVVASVLRQPLERALVDRGVCETAVRECRTEASDSSAEIFCVIEAFDVPRFDYLPDRKKFVKSSAKVSVCCDLEVRDTLTLSSKLFNRITCYLCFLIMI